MGGLKVVQVERGVDAGAAMLFAAAVGYAVSKLSIQPAFAAVGAAIAFVAGFRALRAVQPEAALFELAQFDGRDLELVQVEELLLTDADRIDPPELLLDTALAHFGPDSRVVRLFDPAAMPTPGELKARIDRHLDGSSQAAPADASQALYDALAELRRSLR